MRIRRRVIRSRSYVSWRDLRCSDRISIGYRGISICDRIGLIGLSGNIQYSSDDQKQHDKYRSDRI